MVDACLQAGWPVGLTLQVALLTLQQITGASCRNPLLGPTLTHSFKETFSTSFAMILSGTSSDVVCMTDTDRIVDSGFPRILCCSGFQRDLLNVIRDDTEWHIFRCCLYD